MNIEEAIQKYRDTIDQGRLFNFGGYPAIVDTDIPGYVVIAYVQDNERPGLDIYTVEDFIEYVAEIVAEWEEEE